MREPYNLTNTGFLFGETISEVTNEFILEWRKVNRAIMNIRKQKNREKAALHSVGRNLARYKKQYAQHHSLEID